MPVNETNKSSRQDTIQRIQVGVVGLVGVLLMVSVANFVLQRANDEKSAIEEIQDDTAASSRNILEPEAEAPLAEPLAELGITPAPVTNDGEAGAAPAAGSRAKTDRGQMVPDLKPDPKLEAPMDRER